MKVLHNLFILIFSVGILILPTESFSAQNSTPDQCCTTQGVCHKTLPEKGHKSSGTHDCCSVSVCVFQFINSSENSVSEINQFTNFKQKFSFFFSNKLLQNTYLEGVFQPPKFI